MKETDLKEGDETIITGRPTSWSSLLNERDGRNVVKYPFKCIIDKIQNDSNYFAMSAGNFGWDLTYLIDNNLIKKIKSSENYEIY